MEILNDDCLFEGIESGSYLLRICRSLFIVLGFYILLVDLRLKNLNIIRYHSGHYDVLYSSKTIQAIYIISLLPFPFHRSSQCPFLPSGFGGQYAFFDHTISLLTNINFPPGSSSRPIQICMGKFLFQFVFDFL